MVTLVLETSKPAALQALSLDELQMLQGEALKPDAKPAFRAAVDAESARRITTGEVFRASPVRV